MQQVRAHCEERTDTPCRQSLCENFVKIKGVGEGKERNTERKMQRPACLFRSRRRYRGWSLCLCRSTMGEARFEFAWMVTVRSLGAGISGSCELSDGGLELGSWGIHTLKQ